MSKCHTVGSLRSRKKRKGSSYASIDLDLPDERPAEVEIIRVWDVTASKLTGRISSTRKTHRHVNESMSKPSRKETTPVVEDISGPADYEPSEQPPTKPVPKRRRKKATKENDSVSNVQIPSSEPIFMLADENDGLAFVRVNHFGRIASQGWFGRFHGPRTLRKVHDAGWGISVWRLLWGWDVLFGVHGLDPPPPSATQAPGTPRFTFVRPHHINFKFRSGQTGFSSARPLRVLA